MLFSYTHTACSHRLAGAITFALNTAMRLLSACLPQATLINLRPCSAGNAATPLRLAGERASCTAQQSLAPNSNNIQKKKKTLCRKPDRLAGAPCIRAALPSTACSLFFFLNLNNMCFRRSLHRLAGAYSLLAHAQLCSAQLAVRTFANHMHDTACNSNAVTIYAYTETSNSRAGRYKHYRLAGAHICRPFSAGRAQASLLQSAAACYKPVSRPLQTQNHSTRAPNPGQQ